MSEWAKLTSTSIKSYMEGWVESLDRRNRLLNLLDTRSPEEKQRAREKYEAEQARLAAAEAAKTPAQRLREQQERCHHDFRGTQCRICHKRATAAFVKGYADGFEKGHDEGRDAQCEE